MPTLAGSRGTVPYRSWLADRPIAAYVLLHGSDALPGSPDRLATALADHRLNVWLLDRVDDLVAGARTLTAIARAEQPGLPVILAGHALGGVTAALDVARHPDAYAGVVLSGTPLARTPGRILPPAWSELEALLPELATPVLLLDDTGHDDDVAAIAAFVEDVATPRGSAGLTPLERAARGAVVDSVLGPSRTSRPLDGPLNVCAGAPGGGLSRRGWPRRR